MIDIPPNSLPKIVSLRTNSLSYTNTKPIIFELVTCEGKTMLPVFYEQGLTLGVGSLVQICTCRLISKN